MVARLTNAESTAFIGLLHACGAGDGRAGARAVLRFSDSQDVCVGEAREAAFAEDMHKLFLQRCRGYGTGVEFGAVSARTPQRTHTPQRTPTPQRTRLRGSPGSDVLHIRPTCVERQATPRSCSPLPPLRSVPSPRARGVAGPSRSPWFGPHPSRLPRRQLHDPSHEHTGPRGDGYGARAGGVGTRRGHTQRGHTRRGHTAWAWGVARNVGARGLRGAGVRVCAFVGRFPSAVSFCICVVPGPASHRFYFPSTTCSTPRGRFSPPIAYYPGTRTATRDARPVLKLALPQLADATLVCVWSSSSSRTHTRGHERRPSYAMRTALWRPHLMLSCAMRCVAQACLCGVHAPDPKGKESPRCLVDGEEPIDGRLSTSAERIGGGSVSLLSHWCWSAKGVRSG